MSHCRFLLVVVTVLLIPAASALSAGVYAGLGESAQWRAGHATACGPTATALRDNLNGTWSFDASLVKLPIVGCDGFSVGTVSFPSALWSNQLLGSPETGFAASGTYRLHNPTEDVEWDLVVSPLGLGTTWSIHFFSIQQGYGPAHRWWNGTADLAGAHAGEP